MGGGALKPDNKEELVQSLNPRWRSLDEIVAAHPDGNLRLDLGCGFVKPEGFIGIDDMTGSAVQIASHENAPDVIMDLNNQPLPFPDASCSEVRSSHFLEHSSSVT